LRRGPLLARRGCGCCDALHPWVAMPCTHDRRELAITLPPPSSLLPPPFLLFCPRRLDALSKLPPVAVEHRSYGDSEDTEGGEGDLSQASTPGRGKVDGRGGGEEVEDVEGYDDDGEREAGQEEGDEEGEGVAEEVELEEEEEEEDPALLPMSFPGPTQLRKVPARSGGHGPRAPHRATAVARTVSDQDNDDDDDAFQPRRSGGGGPGSGGGGHGPPAPSVVSGGWLGGALRAAVLPSDAHGRPPAPAPAPGPGPGPSPGAGVAAGGAVVGRPGPPLPPTVSPWHGPGGGRVAGGRSSPTTSGRRGGVGKAGGGGGAKASGGPKGKGGNGGGGGDTRRDGGTAGSSGAAKRPRRENTLSQCWGR
jgi:hypothetical protein